MENKAKKVELEINKIGRGKVIIDGQKVPNVRGFKVEAEAGGLTKLTLTMINVDVNFSGEADVTTIEDSVLNYVVNPSRKAKGPAPQNKSRKRAPENK